MNQAQYQQQRFESQQGPLADTMAYNYGRGSEADYGNYTNMMNQYNDIASNGGGSGGYVSGGGGGGYSPFLVHPQQVATERATAERANTQYGTAQTSQGRSLGPLERISSQQLNPLQQVQAQQLGNNIERVQASDPFKSYAGYQQFADTGGYSGQDIADMRARGVSPIRAAYANAQRAVGQQRSLQGGYSPNAIAAQVKMAREQGQSMADASQNVDAQIAQARNAGRLSGLGGMQNIEGNRLNAQMQGDIFNAGQANQGRQFDISNALQAGQFNSNQAFQGNQFDIQNAMNAAQWNAGQANEGQKFDISNELQNNQFNTGQLNNMSQFNAGQGNNMNQFNAGQANQTSQFNAGQGNNMGQFNANLDFQGQQFNAQAQQQAQSANNAASAASAAQQNAYNQQQTANRLAALNGAQNLYGTTPGMSATFGNQALSAVNSGGNFGIGMMNATNQAQNQPGAFDQSMNRVGQVMNFAQPVSNAIYPWLNGNNRQGTQPVNGGVTYQGGGSYGNPNGAYVEDPNG
jgi:hypothetical protein